MCSPLPFDYFRVKSVKNQLDYPGCNLPGSKVILLGLQPCAISSTPKVLSRREPRLKENVIFKDCNPYGASEKEHSYSCRRQT